MQTCVFGTFISDGQFQLFKTVLKRMDLVRMALLLERRKRKENLPKLPTRKDFPQVKSLRRNKQENV